MPVNGIEGFDWGQWAQTGASVDGLPPEVQSKLSMQFDSINRNRTDPIASMRSRVFEHGKSEEDEISEERVRDIFNNLDRQKQFDREVTELQGELGSEFAKYLPVAQGDIERGLSPRKAFLLARHNDLVAAAELAAESKAQKGAQAALRNAEQPIRGSGASTASASGESPDTGNHWVDSKDSYNTQKQELKRKDFNDAVKWRKDNPEFIEAEKHHGDLTSVSRR